MFSTIISLLFICSCVFILPPFSVFVHAQTFDIKIMTESVMMISPSSTITNPESALVLPSPGQVFYVVVGIGTPPSPVPHKSRFRYHQSSNVGAGSSVQGVLPVPERKGNDNVQYQEFQQLPGIAVQGPNLRAAVRHSIKSWFLPVRPRLHPRSTSSRPFPSHHLVLLIFRIRLWPIQPNTHRRSSHGQPDFRHSWARDGPPLEPFQPAAVGH